MIKEKKSFLGTGWSFPPTFSTTSKTLQMVSEDKDIEQSLFLLIATIPGERMLRPHYGCDLHSQVFQRINNHIKTIIIDLITTAVKHCEPRIILDEVEVKVSPERQGIIFVILHYTIIQTNSRKNMVYPYYIEEGTNLPVIHAREQVFELDQ